MSRMWGDDEMMRGLQFDSGPEIGKAERHSAAIINIAGIT